MTYKGEGAENNNSNTRTHIVGLTSRVTFYGSLTPKQVPQNQIVGE